MLVSCSVVVQCLLRAGEASWAAGRQRSASPGQAGLAGLPCDEGRLLVAGQVLPQCFWATELFQGAGGAGQLLCGSAAPPEGGSS